MADQGRWFKLWHSALSDDALQALSPALRWAWVALGCHTKVHGTAGKVHVAMTNTVLAAQMGVPVEALVDTIRGLPHVHVTVHAPVHDTVDENEGQNRYDTFTVTWQNWNKYQVDSTVAARMRALRSKKRRDEKRRESPPNPPSGGPAGRSLERSEWPDSVGQILERWKARGEAPPDPT